MKSMVSFFFFLEQKMICKKKWFFQIKKKSQFRKEEAAKIFCLGDNIITVHCEEAVATVISFLLNSGKHMTLKCNLNICGLQSSVIL